MPVLDRLTDRRAGKAATAGGALFAASGVVQLVDSQRDTGDDVAGLAGHLALLFFLTGLLAVSPALAALGRRTGTLVGRRAGLVAAAGTAVLGLTCVTSLVHGEDYPFFVVVAPLTNAAWLFGSIALAVLLRRRTSLPALVAVGLPLAWVATIPLGGFGGGLVSGAYWLATGLLLAGERPARVQPRAA